MFGVFGGSATSRPTGTIGGMASWRRPARVALGAFAVLFAVALWFLIGERPTPAAPAAVARLDPEGVAEVKGGDFYQVKGANRDIRVEFSSQVSYQDGRQKLAGFKATIDNRGGRTLVISGEEAWIAANNAAYDIRGNATLSTSDGLTATTPRATFSEAEGILRGDGPVSFQRGRVTGSGVGFSYDRQLDRLWLLDRAVITVAPEHGVGGMQVNAGAAGHSRIERYMRFERGVTLVRDEQTITADEATVFLLQDRDEPDQVELRGNARIAGAGNASAVQHMQARDINLDYASDGRTLQQAVLYEQAGVQLGRADGSAGQKLYAQFIDVALAADGQVTDLVARDRVRVELPATAAAPPRAVTAASLTGNGEAGKGLTAMTFENGAEYRESPPGAVERVARARTLTAALSDSGTIDRATFVGSFQFEQGRLRVTSGNAEYDVTKGVLELTSPPKITRPHMQDERVTIDAQTLDVTLDPRRIEAAGTVVMQLGAGRRRDGDRGTTLLSDAEAVIINADKATLDEASGTGTYSGQARLWQQTSGTSIRAETITMNEKAGTLEASGKVVTTLPMAAENEGGKPGTSLAQAAEFVFEDAKRRAVFTKQAQLDSAQGNLRGQRIELLLNDRDNQVRRLEARGEPVTITLDKREATGAHLVYEAAEEKYVLTGKPGRFLENCQETTGRTLTFFRASDRMIIDGNEEVRTQSRGSKCPDGRR